MQYLDKFDQAWIDSVHILPAHSLVCIPRFLERTFNPPPESEQAGRLRLPPLWRATDHSTQRSLSAGHSWPNCHFHRPAVPCRSAAQFSRGRWRRPTSGLIKADSLYKGAARTIVALILSNCSSIGSEKSARNQGIAASKCSRGVLTIAT